MRHGSESDAVASRRMDQSGPPSWTSTSTMSTDFTSEDVAALGKFKMVLASSALAGFAIMAGASYFAMVSRRPCCLPVQTQTQTR